MQTCLTSDCKLIIVRLEDVPSGKLFRDLWKMDYWSIKFLVVENELKSTINLNASCSFKVTTTGQYDKYITNYYEFYCQK